RRRSSRRGCPWALRHQDPRSGPGVVCGRTLHPWKLPLSLPSNVEREVLGLEASRLVDIERGALVLCGGLASLSGDRLRELKVHGYVFALLGRLDELLLERGEHLGCLDGLHGCDGCLDGLRCVAGLSRSSCLGRPTSFLVLEEGVDGLESLDDDRCDRVQILLL